jgi:hypothetical protein
MFPAEFYKHSRTIEGAILSQRSCPGAILLKKKSLIKRESCLQARAFID